MLRTAHVVSRDDPRLELARHFVQELAESLARTPRGLPVDGFDRLAAPDRTATVTCVVDVRGDFVDLSIGADWWYTVGPSGIAAAVLDALQFAQDKAMLVQAALRREHRPVPPRPGNPSEAARSMPRHDTAAEWAAAQTTVERAYALMDAADRLAQLRDSPQPRTITGPRGLFSLRLAGFTVLDGEVAVHRLSPADGERLADDARAVLRQATREQDPAYWFAGEVAAR